MAEADLESKLERTLEEIYPTRGSYLGALKRGRVPDPDRVPDVRSLALLKFVDFEEGPEDPRRPMSAVHQLAESLSTTLGGIVGRREDGDANAKIHLAVRRDRLMALVWAKPTHRDELLRSVLPDFLTVRFGAASPEEAAVVIGRFYYERGKDLPDRIADLAPLAASAMHTIASQRRRMVVELRKLFDLSVALRGARDEWKGVPMRLVGEKRLPPGIMHWFRVSEFSRINQIPERERKSALFRLYAQYVRNDRMDVLEHEEPYVCLDRNGDHQLIHALCWQLVLGKDADEITEEVPRT